MACTAATSAVEEEEEGCEGTKTLGQLSALVIFFICLALGTDVTIDSAKATLREKKKAVLIGWCSQFGFMPLICYAFCHLFEYPDAIAIGCILTGSAPGGTTSNLAAFFSLGDVTLSIIMSVASTACSLFMLPVLVAVYIETSFSSDEVKIDWMVLILSLLLILIPVGMGMALRAYNTKMKVYCCGWFRCDEGIMVWQFVAKLGTLLGTFILLFLVLWGVAQEDDVMSSGWDLWVPAFMLQPLGFIFGYGVSSMTDLNRPEKRTVSLETGMQNYAVPIAICTLNWGDDCGVLRDTLRFPILATVMYVVTSVGMVLFYRFAHAFNDPPGTRPASDDEANSSCVCCCCGDGACCGDGVPSRRLGSVGYREPEPKLATVGNQPAPQVTHKFTDHSEV